MRVLHGHFSQPVTGRQGRSLRPWPVAQLVGRSSRALKGCRFSSRPGTYPGACPVPSLAAYGRQPSMFLSPLGASSPSPPSSLSLQIHTSASSGKDEKTGRAARLVWLSGRAPVDL